MVDKTEITLKVETERLISTAAEVELKIGQLEQAFSDMGEKINASVSFWEGDGASSYMMAYREKRDMIDTALLRFRENVTDLRTIAGIYEQTEQAAVEDAGVLPIDCIS